MILKKYLLFTLVALAMVLSGCRDDFRFDEIGEGESNLTMTVGFEPLYSALDNTRASGDAVNTINNITVIAYDNKGKLYKVWRSAEGDFDYTMEENTQMPSDFTPTETQDQAESVTPKAKFTLDAIPFGRYRFYAVANMDLTDDQVADAETLMQQTVTWQDNVSLNNAMFGYFTDNNSGVSPTNFQAPLLTVNTNGKNVTAWLKRTVSKVTVAFNAQHLDNNITIYLKDVQIRNIPKNCAIGKLNEPKRTQELLKEGETLTYFTGSQYDNSWKAQVSRGNPVYGINGAYTGPSQGETESKADYLKRQIAFQHTENTQALYFFENVQPDGVEGTASDKRQDVTGKNAGVSYPNGNDPEDEGWRDNTPCGTYIEVHAYYVDTSAEGNTQGDIIYRFMLGQDTKTDYSAYRNRHYKLTLCFNGKANDVDWHIVYNEPKVRFPRPYYISYLYNHSMMLPVTIEAGENEIEYVQADIISNNWAPDNPGNFDYWSASNQPETRPYNGFLSLWETYQTTVTDPGPSYPENANQDWYENHMRCGKRVYSDMTETPDPTPANPVTGHKSEGTDYAPAPDVNLDSDVYYVKVSKDEKSGNVYELSLPMYTRGLQLIKQTGYTGNNPYVDFTRKAKVQLTIKYKGVDIPTIVEEPIEIIQVQRVVNPKGVFREYNSTRKFNAALMKLDDNNQEDFTPLISEGGPWKAYVVGASADSDDTRDAHNMLTFGGGDKVVKPGGVNVSDTVYGDTGSAVDFDILFKNAMTDNTKSRHAVVRVEYNNNTCYHLIFVRQGDAPVALYEGGVKWHSSNLVAYGQEGKNPLDEGSMFKFGNMNVPIPAKDNVNWEVPWLNVTPEDFMKQGANLLTFTGRDGKSYKWTDADWTVRMPVSTTPSSTVYFGSPGLGGNVRVATAADYANLVVRENIEDNGIQNGELERGYGVLYGNAAGGPSVDMTHAYGYIAGETSESYGMRGVFIYNKETCVNVFFPIGNSGYGHRKDTSSQWPTVEAYGGRPRGLLRYSCNNRWGYFPSTAVGVVYPQGVSDCPLFYDIFMRPGAIYYVERAVNLRTGEFAYRFENDADLTYPVVAFDFNYFSCDFYPISHGNLGQGNDACFVRCVTP